MTDFAESVSTMVWSYWGASSRISVQTALPVSLVHV